MDLLCASFFAGVGGIDQGFKQAGFNTIYANEFDYKAALTYKENFPKVKLDVCDIKELDVNKDIPNFDILLAGFPCQAFSVAGYRQGFADSKGRGNLFFDLLNIIKIKKPKVIFLENVKNLLSHDHGNTFTVIYDSLVDAGYYVKFKVMNACQYANIPQNRERIYIVCFKNKKQYENFSFPEPIELTKSLNDFIDFNNDVDEKYYYNNKCPFYDSLIEKITTSDTCYQWRRKYVRKNMNHMCPTLTANMGMGGHNVPLILTTSGKIRKLTPRECFNLQGFPSKYKIPKDSINSALYKQAGNSVVVKVVETIAVNIKKVLKND